MRVRRALIGAAAAGVMVVGGAGAASAKPVTQVVHVTAVSYDEAGTHHGHSISFTEVLYQSSSKVGHDAITCKFNSDYTSAKCQGVFTFAGTGQLFARVSIPDVSQTEASGKITGGTDALTNAKGTVDIVFGPDNGTTSTSYETFTYHV